MFSEVVFNQGNPGNFLNEAQLNRAEFISVFIPQILSWKTEDLVISTLLDYRVVMIFLLKAFFIISFLVNIENHRVNYASLM